VGSHHSRLEQLEDRLSWLKDKIDIKEKNKRTLRQKTQELWKEYTGIQWLHEKTKRVNHGHWRRRKGVSQGVTKYIQQNCPNLKKKLHIQVKEASRTQNRLDQNRTSPLHIIIKTTSTENKERILKAVIEKNK
jgi:hypothetical protein